VNEEEIIGDRCFLNENEASLYLAEHDYIAKCERPRPAEKVLFADLDRNPNSEQRCEHLISPFRFSNILQQIVS